MKKLSLVVVFSLVFMLGACGLTKKDLGFGHQGPDETKVITKKPLILPPEYSVRPKSLELDDEAEDVLEDE